MIGGVVVFSEGHSGNVLRKDSEFVTQRERGSCRGEIKADGE